MVDAYELCPSPYMAGKELAGDTVVTIERVNKTSQVQTKEGAREKSTIDVKEYPGRPWILCATNRDALIALLGRNTDEWVGKQVTIYQSTTRLKGKMVPCIRVREDLPEQVRLASYDQITIIGQLIYAAGVTEEEKSAWLNRAGVAKFSEMRFEDMAKLIEYLRKRVPEE